MQAASDAALIAACTAEARCLVTLDLDFANPLRFPPAGYAGIVVGKLWIIEPGRVREYLPEP
jgi:hypothetical protein